METLIYLGKVNLYWILLYACYHLVLRKHTFFELNRSYLVGSLLLAFVLPLIIYPDTAPAIPVMYEVSSASFSISNAEVEEASIFNWANLAFVVYGLGVITMLYQLFRNISQLNQFLSSGEIVDLEDCKVVLIDSNNIGSFSFLKWIVVNRSDYENHFDAILRHEMVHTKQWHSADILFLEILKIIFWFNPVFAYYKTAMQEVHEFLADSKAPNRENYATFLLSYALNAPIASLTNHFFKPSQIKTRIQMIYKNRTSKWLLSTYLLTLTSIGLIAFLVAGCEQKPLADATEVKEMAKSTNEVKVETPEIKKVYTVVEEQPMFPGGQSKMYEFMGENMKYPEAASRANVSGRVYLSFVVSETGEIGDIQVLKGIGFGCDEEAIRVLKAFPKWIPAKQDGRAVSVKYNLPINFQLKNKIDRKTSVKIDLDKANALYILDGKVMENFDIKSVSTNDIESIDVLKGESALTQYGEKGKNGVIMITMKKI